MLNGSAVGANAVRRNSSIAHQKQQQRNENPTLAVTGNINLTQVEDIYNMVKLLHGNGRRLEGKDDAKMDKAFRDHADAVFRRLRGSLSSLEEEFERSAETLMAKHGLFDVCFQEVISYTEKINPDLSRVLRKIRSAHTSMFQAFPPIVGEARDFSKSVVEEIRAESEVSKKQRYKCQFHTLTQPFPRDLPQRGIQRVRADTIKETELLKADLSRSEMETNQLLEAAELLEEEVKTKDGEIEKLRRALKQARLENANMREQITSLDKLGGSGGSGKAFILRGKNNRTNLSFASDGQRKQQRQQESKVEQPLQVPLPPNLPSTPKEAASVDDERDLTIRNISLNQLMSFIEELYASKAKYDKKCAEGHLARETMEQHMYTFLNQRYGLRSLIVENASAVIKAVNMFSVESTDVAVFGKIIKNEIDEEFRFVIEQLKDSIKSLLHVALKAKNPNKPEDQIVKLSNSITSSTISHSLSSDIVGYMYNEEDSLTLRKMLDDEGRRAGGMEERRRAEREVTRGTPRSQDNEKQGGASKESSIPIPFPLFEKVLMDFQLLGHDRFLSKFRECFSRLDQDGDGILSEDDFITLCSLVGKPTTKGKVKVKERSDDELNNFLSAADPFNHSSVTFSSAVACLSEDIVEQVMDMHDKQKRKKELDSRREGGMKKGVGDRMRRLVSL